ncbi:TatD family hydrolase [Chitinispirillales bacterium ANBcel5]|uniref:TatD family hydrolase n=1 Tax=Cellulosispirillum alkaliphilum TaxID=3039283 RepID=UPI002A5245AC|nr:TatD family hydrolase [Chitinispirillales bacterium ANBcel5]
MWIDIHSHLFDLTRDQLVQTIRQAGSAGIDAIINNAVSVQTAHTVVQQSTIHPSLFAAAGISPFDVEDQPHDWYQVLEHYCKTKKIIAVGEIGLDSSNPRYPSLQKQEPFFKKQLTLATEYGLPTLVHSRGMEYQVCRICREQQAKKVVFHCFTGDEKSLNYLLECGFYVSISGIVTYKNSHLPDIVPKIPLDRLFIETDSPYLAPIPKRGTTNQPAYVQYTAKHISKLLEVSEEKLQTQLRYNFKEVFGADL